MCGRHYRKVPFWKLATADCFRCALTEFCLQNADAVVRPREHMQHRQRRRAQSRGGKFDVQDACIVISICIDLITASATVGKYTLHISDLSGWNSISVFSAPLEIDNQFRRTRLNFTPRKAIDGNLKLS